MNDPKKFNKNCFILIMEYMNGGSVADLVKRKRG